MKDYRVTIWAGPKKYCYVMGCTDIEAYAKTLKVLHNRFTIEELPNALFSL
jgi:hypothetical protein